LTSRNWKCAGIMILTLMIPGLILWARPTAHATSSREALREKVVQLLRERYAIADNVQVTAGPLESSQDPAFYECLITYDNGQKKSAQPVSISKDGRYLAVSPLFYLGSDTNADLTRSIRTYFKLGPEWSLSVGALRPSPVPNFDEIVVTAEKGGQKQDGEFYITKDKRFAALGTVFIVRTSREIERMINTRNQPCSGPANAPVTIVEYADLECPTCARLQPFLENDLLPRYQNKIRLIYKEFPLPMHTWSRKAAIASQCAYEIDPSAFVRYRSSIFAHQSEINVTNVRDQLLQLGESAGINRLKLAACMDSEATLSRVEADLREGNELQVTSTPTCFINGKMVVGIQPPAEFYKVIDGALRHAQ